MESTCLNTTYEEDEEDKMLSPKYPKYKDEANKQLEEIFRSCMKEKEKKTYRFGELLYPNASMILEEEDESKANRGLCNNRLKRLGIGAVVVFCCLNLYSDMKKVMLRANSVMGKNEKKSKVALVSVERLDGLQSEGLSLKGGRSMVLKDDKKGGEESLQRLEESEGRSGGAVGRRQSEAEGKSVFDKPLFQALREVDRLPDGKSHVDQFPFFWQTVPDVKRGYRQGWFLDNCFDLTRANVDGPNGSHKITFLSKRKPFPQEDVIVASNVFEVPKLFKPEETHHQRGLMISLIAHPVQRAALIFDYLQKTTVDPGYDPRMATMDLAAYAKLLLTGDDSLASLQLYRMSNWLTRSLSFAGPHEVLTDRHLEEATLVLQERCFVGLFSEVEESMKRFQQVLAIKAPDQTAMDSCFKNYASQALVPLVTPDTQEWDLLAQINSFDIRLYENAKRIFAQQGNTLFAHKKLPQNFLTDKTDKASNRLYAVFRDISDLSTTTHSYEEEFPYFWETFPQSHGRKELLWFSDHCFDFTRAKVIGAKGAHQIVHTSQTNPSPQETIISAYNVLEAINIFHERDINHRAARLFAFFLHPVQRAALLFQHYRISGNQPDYDDRVRNMSLEQFAKFIIEDNSVIFFKTIRFKLSNYLTRILTGVPFPEPLTTKHVDAAANLLRDKCIVGLVDQMEESLHRVKHALHINDTSREHKQATNECFWEFLTQPIVPNTVQEGTEAWNLLAQLNDADILLYQHIKNIFAEQGNTLFTDLEYTQMRNLGILE